MLKYEFIKCMELRNKLAEKIKGQIFVGKNNNKITINICGCPTCRYQVDLYKINDVNKLADIIYDKYKNFINDKFFK